MTGYCFHIFMIVLYTMYIRGPRKKFARSRQWQNIIPHLGPRPSASRPFFISLVRRHVLVPRLRVSHMTLPFHISCPGHRLSHCFGAIPLSSIHSAWAGDIIQTSHLKPIPPTVPTHSISLTTMFPTRIPRAAASGFGGANMQKFMMNQPKNNSVIVGVAGLMGLTGLLYWWGYHDMDLRHPVTTKVGIRITNLEDLSTFALQPTSPLLKYLFNHNGSCTSRKTKEKLYL
ncbi:hypothetical protein DFS33DRAFT_800101 [Desarmillaria ectypa]|nr:hypothetical protein DFS33DRAFT_800101 [Desarmillaria ectypa]